MSKDKTKKAGRNNSFKDAEIARLRVALASAFIDRDRLVLKEVDLMNDLQTAVYTGVYLAGENERLKSELDMSQNCAQEYLAKLDSLRANLGIRESVKIFEAP